jgi:hypothetical protein
MRVFSPLRVVGTGSPDQCDSAILGVQGGDSFSAIRARRSTSVNLRSDARTDSQFAEGSDDAERDAARRVDPARHRAGAIGGVMGATATRFGGVVRRAGGFNPTTNQPEFGT